MLLLLRGGAEALDLELLFLRETAIGREGQRRQRLENRNKRKK